MRRSPLKRKSLMKRGAKRVRQVSAKRVAENVVRRKVVERIVKERGLDCEARVEKVCKGQAVDAHEKLTRGRGGSIIDPTNILLVCRECHTWIDEHPAEAKRRGLVESAAPRMSDGPTAE